MTRVKVVLAALVAAVFAVMPMAAQARPEQAQTTQVVPGAAVALSILEQIGFGVAQSAGSNALTQALSLMGIGPNPGTAAELASINESLNKINSQLTQLREESSKIQNSLNQSSYDSALRDARPIIDAINSAEGDLQLAARERPGPTQTRIAEQARDTIKNKLVGQWQTLANIVGGSGPVLPTSIIGAAYKVATQSNFVTPRSSVEVRYIIDYYTSYEAALAQLLASYYLSFPRPSGAQIMEIVNTTRSNVTRQLGERRDAVPDNTVVDVRTGLMWYTGPTLPTMTDPGTDAAPDGWLKNQPPGTPFPDWRLPSRSEMEGLIAGRPGSAYDWLRNNAGFPAFLDGSGGSTNGELWTSTAQQYVGVGRLMTDECSLPTSRYVQYTLTVRCAAQLNQYWLLSTRTGGFLAWIGVPKEGAAQPITSTVSMPKHDRGYIPVRFSPPGSYFPPA